MGTCATASSPRAPCRRLPPPFPPRPALSRRRVDSADRSRRSGLATSTTSPPSPPSPPSGPPFGTNFSRLNESAPSPPRPACTWMRARSWNMAAPLVAVDVDEAAVAAPPELDDSVAHGEDRVVASEARARPGAEPRPALPDDDHPGRHGLAVGDLHAKHLRV